jgi:hypothetical protein
VCSSSIKQSLSAPHHKVPCSRHDIAEKLLTLHNNHHHTPLSSAGTTITITLPYLLLAQQSP